MITSCPACAEPVTCDIFTRRCQCHACNAKLEIRSGLGGFSFDAAFWKITYFLAITALLYVFAFFLLGVWPAMSKDLAWILSFFLSALLVHVILWRFHARLALAQE